MKNKTSVLLVVLIAIVGFVYWVQTNGNASAPLNSETTDLAVVKVPALSGLALAGKTVFDASCASCHGVNAAGQDGVAPTLIQRIYAPNHHSDAAFLIAAKLGVRAHHWKFGSMPPVEGLSDDDIAAATEYVRALQRENGIGL